MSTRRSRGDGGLHWDKRRQRWVATATVGYDGRGKRLVRHGYGRTKTEAKAKLRDLLRSREDGVVLTRDGTTVRQVVEDWLEHGLSSRDKATRDANRHLCEKHVLPYLGARKLRDLTATEVDEWLATLATSLSTRTLQRVRACLNRAVRRAMARDKVKRNVVGLTEVPAGLPGRPSKAMSAQQADDAITKTASDRMHSYIAVSLLTGARTEELRALRWEHVHLEGRPDVMPPVPPFVEVWRSVRAGGDTKTMKSRRTIALPDLCVRALVTLRAQQDAERRAAGEQWHETGLVITTRLGTAMDAANVRRDFRRALALVPGLKPEEWTPRELRHSFVSLLSDAGVPIEDVSRLVGHSSTSVTELVYRHQIRPVIQSGATIMDWLFGSPADRRAAEAVAADNGVESQARSWRPQ
jgi:integrase